MRILVFGNPYLEYDSLALKIASGLKLEGVSFVNCSSPEQILNEKFDCILDVVDGISEVKVFDNLKMLNPHRMFSLHDFDLTFFLSLMEKIGKIEKIKIIGVPMGYDEVKAKGEVEKMLKNY